MTNPVEPPKELYYKYRYPLTGNAYAVCSVFPSGDATCPDVAKYVRTDRAELMVKLAEAQERLNWLSPYNQPPYSDADRQAAIDEIKQLKEQLQ